VVQWHKAVQEFQLQPHNIYNMDEKGFMMGLGARTKIIYARNIARKDLLQGVLPIIL
jgi:hypothetical protein